MSNELIDIINNLTEIINKKKETLGEALPVSELLKVLDKYERKDIEYKLTRVPYCSEDDTLNIGIKADTINSIILLFLEKPKLKKIIDDSKNNENEISKNIIHKLHKISFELYKNYNSCLLSLSKDINIYSFVLACLNGILADCTCEVDSYITSNIDNLLSSIPQEKTLIRLEYKIYFLILFLIKRFNNISNLNDFDQLIVDSECLLKELQEEELKNELFNISNGFYISALANILHVIKLVKNYLFKGETDLKSDIMTDIDTYSYNAINLLNETNHLELKQITILLRYALKQVCNNSLWGVYGKNPLVNKFIKKCFEANDNLIYSLLPSQRKAIIENKLLSPSKSIVINMPTSAGKTLIAELYILFTLHNLTENQGAENQFRPTICYIVPTNALLNQTKSKLKEEFKDFNLNIETTLPFYDVDNIEREFLNKHIDILISTPEKLDFLIRSNDESLKDLRLVILDEAHNISDETRGAKFELLLATIKQTRKDVNFLLLSPFIDNAKEISKWLGDDDNVDISIEWSPTKQFIAYSSLHSKNGLSKSISKLVYMPTAANNLLNEKLVIDVEQNLRDIKNILDFDSVDYIVKSIVLIQEYLKTGGNVLVFCNFTSRSQNLALSCKDYFLKTNNIYLKDISDNEEIKKAITLIKLNSSENDPLIECLKYGIAYHHAKLSDQIKVEVERLISKNLIKIVCASSTLAQGMNFPLSTIIFNTLKLGGGESTRDIDNATFWNIAGRAGRAFKDDEGHIIITQQNDSNPKTEKLVKSYIGHNANFIVSSLSEFFNQFDSSKSIVFNHAFLKEVNKKYGGVSNFLQYLNHIVRVIHKYNFENINTSVINNILSNSLIYKEIEAESGFYKSQEKIRYFAQKYLNHIKDNKNKKLLKDADLLGISDISYSSFFGLITGLKELYKDDLNQLNLAEQILKRKDETVVADILQRLSTIPELDLNFRNQGDARFDNIAKIIIGWVNGMHIKDIASNIKEPTESYEKVLGDCNRYINQKLKSFIPWGASIYQHIMNESDTEDSQNLPSFLYYGVNNKDSVILSKLGVPRFAVEEIKNKIKTEFKKDISVSNMDEIKSLILSFKPDAYNFTHNDTKIVKDLVDSSIK